MALRQLGRALGGTLVGARGAWASLGGTAAAPVPSASAELACGARQQPAQQQQQRRGVVSVDVVNNNVDRALRDLRRKLRDDGILAEWKAGEYYTKPCEERKAAQLESDKRLRRRAFKRKLNWIMLRKARGF